MTMQISNALILAVILSCWPMTGAVPASCTPDWKIDWNRPPPDFSKFGLFSHPGEIFPGVTIHDTLEVVGHLWNAPSWQEVMGRVCIQCGPFLHAVYPGKQIRKTCDMIVTSIKKQEKPDVSGMCTSYLERIEVEIDTIVKRYHKFFNFLPTNIEPFAINLLFSFVDWLGPSSSDLFRACSEVPELLRQNIDETLDLVKILLRNFVGPFVLQNLHRRNVCMKMQNLGVDFLHRIKFSKDEYMCDFLSKYHSTREYIEKGAQVTDTVMKIPYNVDLCTDVIGFLSSYDNYGSTGYFLTKRNFTSRSNRRQFCHEIKSALSGNDQTETYYFPKNYDIKKWEIFAESGQILPGFSFLDVINVIGAFLKSDTFSDGGIFLCDTFEPFLSEVIDPSVKGTCTALRNGDTVAVVKKCRATFSPSEQPLAPTSESSVICTIMAAVKMTIRLSDLPAVTPDNFCSTLNHFLYSKNNLQSVIRLGLHNILGNIIPTVDLFCRDIDLTLLLFDAVEDKEISAFQYNLFQKFVKVFKDITLAHLGFSDAKQFCRTIAAGMDTFSWEAKSSLLKNMEDRALKFLTDTGRCVATIHALSLHITGGSHQEFYEGFNQLTGFLSIKHFCATMSDMFDPKRCEDSVKDEL